MWGRASFWKSRVTVEKNGYGRKGKMKKMGVEKEGRERTCHV